MTEIQFGAIAILSLGIFFRCATLSKKLYWFDEAYTSLRISGYSEAEVIQQVFNGEAITPLDLQKYQQPNSHKTVRGTVLGLAREEPQHPPLYYVLVRFWAQRFGSSAATVRSLSVIFSLLVFPCLYWLCLELFGSPDVAWLAIALVAISPIHVVFAQEARQYSLWTALILASSAALLQAIRLDTVASWAIYAATLSLGLYTFLFSALVAIGHGTYVIVLHHGTAHHGTAIVQHYLIASAVGLLSFLPWIVAIATRHRSVQTTTAWANRSSSWMAIARAWALNLRRMFFDADMRPYFKFAYTPSLICIYAFVLLLQGSALYFVWRTAPVQGLFISTLVGVTALAMLLPDLILGGQRSTATRYAIPCYLGLQLAIAYLLATQINAISFTLWQHHLGQIVTIIVVSLGIASCLIGLQSELSWSKVVSYYNPAIAQILNQSSRPLLISDTSFGIGEVLSLSRLLHPKVTLQLVVKPNLPHIQDGFSEVFVMTHSQSLRDQLQQQQQASIKASYTARGTVWLWKLTQTPQ